MGLPEGEKDGELDGLVVGDAVGEVDGVTEGAAVGEVDGDTEGAHDGEVEGDVDGMLVQAGMKNSSITVFPQELPRVRVATLFPSASESVITAPVRAHD